MAETAYQIQYRQEYIAGFEQNRSLLSQMVTNEAVIKGNQATFLIADSGDAETVTRGTNGLIPYRADNLTQQVATLTEEHDAVRKTGFNMFASQGNQMEIMQRTSYGTVGRKMDQQILDALSAATQTGGPAATASLRMFTRAKAILGNNAVPNDGNICCVISPAAHAYLMETEEFTSADYVTKHLEQGAPNMFRWAGMTFIEHPNVAGIGTASEVLYVFHKNAIGHAIDIKGMQVISGYNEEHDYSFARTTAYMGAKLLQNAGVVKILHDGSEMAAA